MKEDARERSAKYMETTEKALRQLRKKDLPTMVNQKQVNHVMELVEGYMKDAKHYVAEKPITSLACVAYAEGLLDALRFLGIMEE